MMTKDPFNVETVTLPFSPHIDVCIEPVELCEQCGYLLGTALRFLFSHRHSGYPLKDLLQAQKYLERYIKQARKEYDNQDVDLKGPNLSSYIFKAFGRDFLRGLEGDDLSVCEQLLTWTNNRIEEIQNA